MMFCAFDFQANESRNGSESIIMPLLVNHPQKPPSGHHFQDPSGQILKAESIPALIKAVESYRANNTLPAGDPAAEIERFYAEKFPWLISKVSDGIGAHATLHPTTKSEPLRPWINRMWRNPPKHWQEAEVAKARLAICEKCPHYCDLGFLGPEYSRRLLILAAGRMAASALHCSAHAWACGLAVWLEDPEVLEDVAGCWACGK